jgi:hypothetical protein
MIRVHQEAGLAERAGQLTGREVVRARRPQILPVLALD